MSRQRIPTLIIQQENANYTLMHSVFYHLMSTDGFLHNFEESRRSESIPRIENNYKLTVPRYSPDDFKMHFRLTRATFESTCSRISRQVEFNRQKGPTPNVQNELLMFLWYIGNMDSFRSMTDRFAFPILDWLITTFRDCENLTQQQRLFNKADSKCKQAIERAFGMLKCRFRRLFRFDVSDISFLLVDSVLAACVLQNLCLSENDIFDVPDEEPCDDDFFEREGHQLQEIRRRQQLMNKLVNVR
ncbi:unnamed protein product [Mytilus coruscus]|uniref:DDE Tnp4 domain-containing protein n=1 Tax=Mytilus coruscus TaxID=42192 RepID=A0A6J8AB68_MYTCO|nr:unnamed protein product [Mytilus coruscus]